MRKNKDKKRLRKLNPYYMDGKYWKNKSEYKKAKKEDKENKEK